MAIDDGGPAFPTGEEYDPKGAAGQIMQYKVSGMSMRDYFAAAALQGMLADQRDGSYVTAANYDACGLIAYKYADAMLAARSAAPAAGEAT